jgi:hypothetical protein
MTLEEVMPDGIRKIEQVKQAIEIKKLDWSGEATYYLMQPSFNEEEFVIAHSFFVNGGAETVLLPSNAMGEVKSWKGIECVSGFGHNLIFDHIGYQIIERYTSLDII